MANNYIGNDDANVNSRPGFGYGYGDGGGGLVMVVLFLLILFAIFGGGFGRFGRDGEGHGHGCGCGTHGCRPAYYDESNYEQDKYTCGKFDKGYEVAHFEGEKTRALIEQNYVQDLRDKLSDKNTEIVALKGQIYSDAKFGEVFGKLGHIECEMLKRPPVWGCADTPVVKHVDNQCTPCEPRRGRFDDGFAFA